MTEKLQTKKFNTLQPPTTDNMEHICRNCEAAIVAEYRYCPSCSQRTQLHRLSLHDVAHEAIHYVTHADRGLFNLIRDLTVKTGTVAREYIGGMRKKYFPPLNFYLIVGVIVLFAYNFQGLPPEMDAMAHRNVAGVTDPETIAQIRQAKIQLFMSQKSDLLMILALPITAFAFWLFYRRAKYNFTEHLVACMYMAGYFMLIYALLLIPIGTIFNLPNYVTSILLFAVQIIYAAIFYHRFMEKRTWTAAFKPLFAAVFGGVLWVAFTMIIAQVYISTAFWGLLD